MQVVILACVLASYFLHIGDAADHGSKPTCSSVGPAEGETRQILFPIRPDLNLDATNLLIRISKHGQTGDVLRCNREESGSQLKCQRGSKTVAPADVLRGNMLSLDFPNVTAELYGTYELRVVVNTTSDPIILCDFHFHGRHVAAADAEWEDEKTQQPLIIGCVVGIFAFVAIIVLLVVLWRSYRPSTWPCGRTTANTHDAIENAENYPLQGHNDAGDGIPVLRDCNPNVDVSGLRSVAEITSKYEEMACDATDSRNLMDATLVSGEAACDPQPPTLPE